MALHERHSKEPNAASQNPILLTPLTPELPLIPLTSVLSPEIYRMDIWFNRESVDLGWRGEWNEWMSFYGPASLLTTGCWDSENFPLKGNIYARSDFSLMRCTMQEREAFVPINIKTKTSCFTSL